MKQWIALFLAALLFAGGLGLAGCGAGGENDGKEKLTEENISDEGENRDANPSQTGTVDNTAREDTQQLDQDGGVLQRVLQNAPLRVKALRMALVMPSPVYAATNNFCSLLHH